MAVYTIQSPDGRKIKVEADDEETAMHGAQEWAAANPAGPAGAKPGSREYADWAADQARQGKTLPMVSDVPPEAAGPDLTGLGGKFDAAFTSAVNDLPIIGPTVLKGMEGVRSAVSGMSPEDVAAEGAAERAANPITSKTAGVLSTIGSLIPLGMTGFGARALGMTGSLPSRVGFGLASGGVLAGADTAARGGDLGDVEMSALMGGGLGALAPLAGAAVRGTMNAVTGKGVSAEAGNLARAARDDGLDLSNLQQHLADFGDGAMLMDLGPNLQAQAGALASVPGPAQKVIRAAVAGRAAGAGQRVSDDVAATVGAGPEIGALKEQIVGAQTAAAKPLYDAVRDVPIQVPPVLNFILKSPLGKEAFQQAQRLAANDGYSSDQMTVGLVDYVKRALDDAAASSARTGNNNVARQARNMTKALTGAVDAQVPGYKAARDAFAGPAQLLDAIDNGATAFTKDMSPPQLKSMLSGMSASERDGFLAGAQSSIEAMMGNALNDPLALRNMFKKGWNDQKLRILLGDDVADDLIARMDREAAFGNTSNVVSRNSETARRLAAQGEVAPDMGKVSGVSLPGLILAAINKARTSIRGAVQPQVNARLAAALKSGAGDIDPAMLEQVRRAALPRPNAMIAPAVPALQLTGPQ